jgi:hypothetical protein
MQRISEYFYGLVVGAAAGLFCVAVQVVAAHPWITQGVVQVVVAGAFVFALVVGVFFVLSGITNVSGLPRISSTMIGTYCFSSFPEIFVSPTSTNATTVYVPGPRALLSLLD